MFPSKTVCLDTTPADITRVHKYNGGEKKKKPLDSYEEWAGVWSESTLVDSLL